MADLGELAAVNARLRAQVEALSTLVAEQDAQLVALSALVETLRAEIADLQARLAQTSSNSSKPPSSDGLAKTPRPARPRQKGARLPGKQPGTPGASLAAAGVPDEVVEHTPDICAGCGSGLADAEIVGHSVRQVFDLPQIRLRVVEHRAQRRRCGCGTQTTAAFPDHATAPVCYGPGVRALIAYLCAYQHLPIDRCAQLLADVLGAPVSTATITAVLAAAPEQVSPAVAAIAERLAAADVVCFDETGARAAGRLHWVHAASTDRLSLYTMHAKRGKEGMDAAGVLPGFAGVAVHDGWAPYRGYDQMTHQLCNAHHIRELAAVAEQGPHQDWAAHLIELLCDAADRVAAARAAGQDALPAEVAAGLRARYAGHLQQGREANPRRASVSGRRVTQPKAVNLLDRLDRYRDDVLRFRTDFRVPFTNNLAEQAVRMVKLAQKISGCWPTLAGGQAFCKTRSYIATARKHGVNPLDALRQAFTGTPWMPPTTGPPPALA